MQDQRTFTVFLLGAGTILGFVGDSTTVVGFPDTPQVAPGIADARQKPARADAHDFHTIPTNDEIDWEVDHLGRVRVLIPVPVTKIDISAANIDALVKHLDDPERFAMGHVILSSSYQKWDRCATAIGGGYDIRYGGLTVKVRYHSKKGVDYKTVEYPDDAKLGAQQRVLAAQWKHVIAWYQKGGIVRKMRSDNRDYLLSTDRWCDNRSYGIEDLSNARIRWRGNGFGSVHPVLLNTHRDEIANGNSKHVPLLLSKLTDKSEYAAAHIALSCIFGVDSFCIVPITRGFDVRLNGLHVLLQTDESRVLQATYPDGDRQQAWLHYRWKTLVHFATNCDKQKKRD